MCRAKNPTKPIRVAETTMVEKPRFLLTWSWPVAVEAPAVRTDVVVMMPLRVGRGLADGAATGCRRQGGTRWSAGHTSVTSPKSTSSK